MIRHMLKCFKLFVLFTYLFFNFYYTQEFINSCFLAKSNILLFLSKFIFIVLVFLMFKLFLFSSTLL